MRRLNNMDEALFEQEMYHLNEGEFLLLQLDKKFMQKQLDSKRQMLEEAIAEGEKEKKSSKKGGMEPMAPAKEALLALPTTVPLWCVGKVAECLPSVIYLIEVYEEGKSEPIRKGYEFREVKNITKITEEDYKTLAEQTKK
jgi:hypothetical protein